MPGRTFAIMAYGLQNVPDSFGRSSRKHVPNRHGYEGGLAMKIGSSWARTASLWTASWQ